MPHSVSDMLRIRYNPAGIPLGITLAIGWAFRLRRIYTSVKNTPERSPRVRRIEVIVVTVLWALIAVSVTILLVSKRN